MSAHPTVDLDRTRGLLLGLLLGDALAYPESKRTSWLTGSAASQLACFTVEGLIRAHVRFAHRGVSGPSGVVWHAYRRWAFIQGLVGVPSSGSDSPWPDGWLHQQAPLARRRGNAPATVSAITGRRPGTPSEPANSSAGHHALSSAASVAMFAGALDLRLAAIEVAALTHGSSEAQRAAADGVELLGMALSTETLSALDVSSCLQHNGAAGTAQAALRNGTKAAIEAPAPSEFLDAIAGASHHGGRGAATFAGALLGACNGVSQLPQEILGRLELGMIGDTLARDTVNQLENEPSGSEYDPNPDQWWWNRYPGW